MKVGVWLNFSISKEVGGGFSYTSELIRLIDNFSFSDELEVVFISSNNINIELNKEVVCLKNSQVSKKENVRKTSLVKKVLKKFINEENKKKPIKIQPSIISQLKENKIDVIYYIDQHPNKFLDFPFIATNWDIGHISMDAFPEVTNNGNFEFRNDWYNNKLRRALGIIVESEAGKEELIKYMSVNESRIHVMPIFPLELLITNSNKKEEQEFLSSNNLKSSKYFFYPAQFWAHKNHMTLLKAFKKFIIEHPDYKLIFTGSDQGNLANVLRAIDSMNLKNNVKYLGFVSKVELYYLYKNSTSLVMPTFLGPTNMPLLEARELDCPVICSDFKGHKEQLGNGAIYIKPNCYDSIYDALIKMTSNEYRHEILMLAANEKCNSKFNSTTAIEYLNDILLKIKNIVDCWSFNY